VRFPCVRAAATSPVQQMGALVALTRPSISAFPSLPRKGCRVGLHIVLFEACSAFTHVAAPTLALSPNFVTSYPKASDISSPPCLLRCFRLERSTGGICTHWKSAAFSRRAPEAVIHRRSRMASRRTLSPRRLHRHQHGAPPRMSSPSTTSAARVSNRSKKAKARLSGRGCRAALLLPTPSVSSFMHWPTISATSYVRWRRPNR